MKHLRKLLCAKEIEYKKYTDSMFLYKIVEFSEVITKIKIRQLIFCLPETEVYGVTSKVHKKTFQDNVNVYIYLHLYCRFNYMVYTFTKTNCALKSVICKLLLQSMNMLELLNACKSKFGLRLFNYPFHSQYPRGKLEVNCHHREVTKKQRK